MIRLKKHFLCFICFIFTQFALAGHSDHIEYNINNIDSNLLIEADVVIRNKFTHVEVKSISDLILEENIVITILNSRGQNSSTLFFPYTSFSDISQIEIELFNADGTFIRKIKNDEIRDYSGSDESSLYDDLRYKVIEPASNNYPYTIKYSYKTKIDGYITPPDWYAITRPRTSIENATLLVDIDNSIKLLYKDFNLSIKDITSKQNETSYKWEVNNFHALPKEYNIPDSMIIYPAVMYYLEEFKIDKTTGSFSSWRDFGDFYYYLNKGSDVLNEEAQKEIQSTISGEKNNYNKIKKLYHWVQSQTRYVSIQKGIGGVQSFDANYVYKNKYGDCKALSNYMMAVLQVAEIKSYPILIQAGNKKKYLNPDTPYDYFNHVILSVPLEKDTIWLECTNQQSPFNYLGSFTSDRFCLQIIENKSKLIYTPSYDLKTNRSDLSGDILFSENGNSICKLTLKQSGEMQDITRSVQFNASTKEKEDWLRNKIVIADFKFKSINFINTEIDTAFTEIDLELESASIIGVSGSRIFIHPKIISGLIDDFPSENDRHFPLELYPEAEENNQITFHIPANYLPESPDKKEIVTSDFGVYNYNLNYDKDKESYILNDKFTLNKKIITPDKYKDWLEFRNKVYKLKNRTIVCKHI